MMVLRVLGVGSPFGDDQLGWEVIKLLQQKPSLHRYLPEELQLRYYDRPGLYLFELMQDTHAVFLIDAIKTGADIGTIHCFKNKAIEHLGKTLSTHNIGIAEAMSLGSELNLLPEDVILYGLEIDEVQCDAHLSPAIIEAINTLSIQIEHDILSWLSFKRLC